MTEKAKETNQQEEISEVSLTQSLGGFAGLLRLLPKLRSTRFAVAGWVIVAPGAKGSFPSSTDDATKLKNIIALSNPQ